MLRRGVDWVSWLVGAAALAAVVVGALHFADLEAFVELAVRAQWPWLAVACVLQAATYGAEGAIWRHVARAAGLQLPLGTAWRLSLVKLFVDQSIPSAGLSGTVVVARALSRLGIGHRQLTAGVVVRIVSYYVAYLVAL